MYHLKYGFICSTEFDYRLTKTMSSVARKCERSDQGWWYQARRAGGFGVDIRHRTTTRVSLDHRPRKRRAGSSSQYYHLDIRLYP